MIGREVWRGEDWNSLSRDRERGGGRVVVKIEGKGGVLKEDK